MKTKTQFLLLLISISFFSCNSTVKNTATPISDINTDFPVSENLDFKPFHKYDILEMGACTVDDSILWFFREGESDFGYCYNLHTGEKLSTIASKGRAANEFTALDNFDIAGDSVAFYTNRNTIKTFAKKDIIENVPMGNRKFSVTIAPDSIWASRMIKLPNGSVLSTIEPALYEYQKLQEVSEFNKKSVAIFNSKEANSYETINYESFDIDKAKGRELPANDLIKSAYCFSSIVARDNNMAVFALSDQFMLYTFDLKNGGVVNEKRYTKMQREKAESDTFTSFRTVNDRKITIDNIITNDKYIFCDVGGYLSEEDKNAKLYKRAIFVFDWKLNPIKKFDLPRRENGYNKLSNDGSAVYFFEFNEEGLTLHKADLNI